MTLEVIENRMEFKQSYSPYKISAQSDEKWLRYSQYKHLGGRYNGGLRPVSLGSTHEKETDIGLSAT